VLTVAAVMWAITGAGWPHSRRGSSRRSYCRDGAPMQPDAPRAVELRDKIARLEEREEERRWDRIRAGHDGNLARMQELDREATQLSKQRARLRKRATEAPRVVRARARKANGPGTTGAVLVRRSDARTPYPTKIQPHAEAVSYSDNSRAQKSPVSGASVNGRYWARTRREASELAATGIDLARLSETLAASDFLNRLALSPTLIHSALGQLKDVLVSSDELRAVAASLLALLLEEEDDDGRGW
jgi:hypothetical protein